MSDRACLATLLACLAASLAAYAVLGVVLSSPPGGWDGYAGFATAAAEMFRARMGVPAWKLSPATFQRALAGLFVALWAVWGLAVLTLRRASPEARVLARRVVLGGGAA